MDLSTGEILLATFKQMLTEISASLRSELSPKRRESIIEFITATKKAIYASQMAMSRSGYRPDLELVELWNDALRKCAAARVEQKVADWLYYKASFWGEPHVWLNETASLKLVPTLRELDNECDGLFQQISTKS